MPPSLAPLGALHGHAGRAWHCAFSPDGRRLASCGSDRTIRLWKEGEDGAWTCEAVLKDAHERTVRRLAWFPDGSKLAAASFDGTVSVWRKVAKGKWEVGAVLEGHENEVKDVAVDRAGVYLATCGRDKTVWIWELMDLGAATSMDDDGNDDDAAMESDDDLPALEFECADLKRGHGGDVKAVAWHPERPFFVSASYDDSVRVWTHDPARDEWRCAQELADTAAGGSAGHAGTVWDVAFEPTAARPDARAECRMATCSDDRAILVWSAAKDPDARPDDPPRFSLNQRLVDAHERSVLSIAWSPLGVIATAGADDALCVYADAKAGAGYERVCRVESAHGGDVNCVRFNPVRQANRVLVATAGDDAAVRLWTLTM